MPLLKDGRIVEDTWQTVADGEPVPASGAVVIPFVRWRAERAALIGRNAPIGVRVANTVAVADLGADADRFGLVILEFPKFIDGRAFTQARLLRERYGYRGEIRAVGNVLRDQLLFMHRCGFDAYEIASPKALEWWEAAMAEFTVFYQPAADGRVTVPELRREAAETGSVR